MMGRRGRRGREGTRWGGGEGEGEKVHGGEEGKERERRYMMGRRGRRGEKVHDGEEGKERGEGTEVFSLSTPSSLQ